MKQNDVEAIKKMADVVSHGIPFPIGTLGYIIARKMIDLNGYYTYTDMEGKKVFIQDIKISRQSPADMGSWE